MQYGAQAYGEWLWLVTRSQAGFIAVKKLKWICLCLAGIEVSQ